MLIEVEFRALLLQSHRRVVRGDGRDAGVGPLEVKNHPMTAWTAPFSIYPAHGEESGIMVPAAEGDAGGSSVIIWAAAVHVGSACGQKQVHVYRR